MATKHLTLKQLYDEVYLARWAGTAGEVTACINAQSALDFFGDEFVPGVQYTSNLGNKFLAHLKASGLKNATINRKMAALSALLKAAGPTLLVPPRLREVQDRMATLSGDEIDNLVRTMASNHGTEYGLFFRVLADTGLRLGELLCLTPLDISVHESWDIRKRERNALPISITVQGSFAKSGKTRTVPLTVSGALALEAVYLKATEDSSGRHRTPLWSFESQSPLRSAFNNCLDKLGWRDRGLVIHSLRHSFCSRLIAANVPIAQVQQLAGHADIKTTLRYVHHDPAHLAEAIAALNPKEAS